MSSLVQQPSAEHYGHAYESKRRLASYWHQVEECLSLGGKSVLLIGKGSGLIPFLLEKDGFKVTTVDLQLELKPAVLGDVRQLPFPNGAFDTAVCCEVLEHLPFEFFLSSLRELKRIVRHGVVLSLPDRGKYLKYLPYLLFRRKEILDLPNFFLKPWVFNGEHFWEVNTKGYSLRDVQRAIDVAGLKVQHTFRVWELPYHRFWRLTK